MYYLYNSIRIAQLLPLCGHLVYVLHTLLQGTVGLSDAVFQSKLKHLNMERQQRVQVYKSKRERTSVYTVCVDRGIE